MAQSNRKTISPEKFANIFYKIYEATPGNGRKSPGMETFKLSAKLFRELAEYTMLDNGWHLWSLIRPVPADTEKGNRLSTSEGVR